MSETGLRTVQNPKLPGIKILILAGNHYVFRSIKLEVAAHNEGLLGNTHEILMKNVYKTLSMSGASSHMNVKWPDNILIV